jgi:hypothetical protein
MAWTCKLTSFIKETAITTVIRVDRLGEFSPIGSLFTLGCFMKSTEIAQIVCLLFSTVKVMHIFLPELFLATFWAIFFTDSSGHPGGDTETKFLTFFTPKLFFSRSKAG